jgi:hydroxypyruvate reductase
VTDLRAIARKCLDAGVAAVDPRRLVREKLEERAVGGRLPDWLSDRPWTLVAVGKAALGMARGAVDGLGRSVRGGLVVVPEGVAGDYRDLAGRGIDVVLAGHPLPNEGSCEAGQRVARIARTARTGEQLLVLLSGGASALLSLPAGELALSEIQRTTDLLLRAGASIEELNTVRKQLDELKGGGMAQLASPARVLGLVISDVVGNRLDVIASGPLVRDRSLPRDAIAVLRQRKVWSDIPRAVRRHLETPQKTAAGRESASNWHHVDVQIVGDNELAMRAMLETASGCGFMGKLLTTSLVGEAREIGAQLASVEREIRTRRQPLAAPACLVAGGETTVTVRGAGRGGRNQELVLAAAIHLGGTEKVLVASMGSDGVDGPTDAAGAWADGETVERGTRLGLDASAALEANDAYSYFGALDDLIVTGPTGTNVMDLVLLLVE